MNKCLKALVVDLETKKGSSDNNIVLTFIHLATKFSNLLVLRSKANIDMDRLVQGGMLIKENVDYLKVADSLQWLINTDLNNK